MKKYDGKLCVSCKHSVIHRPTGKYVGKAKMTCNQAKERKDVSMFGSCENFEDRRTGGDG